VLNPKDGKKISVPALIIAGERDCVRPAETKNIAAAIKGAWLQTLTGYNHCSYVINTDILYDFVRDFLSACR